MNSQQEVPAIRPLAVLVLFDAGGVASAFIETHVNEINAPLALSLDAAGNHRVDTDEKWFAFSGDGRYVLGMTRGETQRLARGLALGVR